MIGKKIPAQLNRGQKVMESLSKSQVEYLEVYRHPLMVMARVEFWRFLIVSVVNDPKLNKYTLFSFMSTDFIHFTLILYYTIFLLKFSACKKHNFSLNENVDGAGNSGTECPKKETETGTVP